MRRIVFVGVCALAVVFSATPVEAKKKPKATTTTTLAVTVDSLNPLLLDIEDMPTGWAVNATPPLISSPTGGVCNGPNSAARADASGSNVRSTYVSYSQDPTIGPAISEVVYVFPTKKQAKAFMEANRSAETDTLPDRPDSVTSTNDVLYLRNGRIVVNLNNSALNLDPNLTSQYARKALDKLAPVLG
jgi:hypothetical protein